MTARLIAVAGVPPQIVLQEMIEVLLGSARACRIAAARALGAVGSLGAVESLVPLTKAFLGGGELQLAARVAIQRIQGRAGPADAGGLSLVGGSEPAGGLSLPAAERDEVGPA